VLTAGVDGPCDWVKCIKCLRTAHLTAATSLAALTAGVDVVTRCVVTADMSCECCYGRPM